ncbi:MAG: type II secretion system protein [Armatimonadota bacterium]|nr:type II secretion system protein [Armatimonadota bacterium]
MGRRGARSAFTLIELLVVIAMLAVLAAIILAVFPRAREMARRATCVSNCRQIVQAARMYAHDHDQRLAPARIRGAPAPNVGYTWCVLLQPYMKSEEILVCPNDGEPTATARHVCLPHSYGMNYRLTYNTAFGWSPGALTSKLTTVSDHSGTILTFEIDPELRQAGASYLQHRLSRVEARHDQRAVFGFLDGHCKALQPEQTIGKGLNMWEPG